MKPNADGERGSKLGHVSMVKLGKLVVEGLMLIPRNVGRRLVYRLGDSGKSVKDSAELELLSGEELVPESTASILMSATCLWKRPENVISTALADNGQSGATSPPVPSAGITGCGLCPDGGIIPRRL